MQCIQEEPAINAYFFQDDGIIPNNLLPVLVYPQLVTGKDSSQGLEDRFRNNGWTNNWRDIILPYDHFHSNTHEVLGVGKGTVSLQIGGALGKALTLHQGDVLILPAGVGHYALPEYQDYEIVGGYPGGANWNLLTGTLAERSLALPQISQVPLPESDPIYGVSGPLFSYWSSTELV